MVGVPAHTGNSTEGVVTYIDVSLINEAELWAQLHGSQRSGWDGLPNNSIYSHPQAKQKKHNEKKTLQ